MDGIKKITDENFQKEVNNADKPVCVIFSDTSYCQPCVQLHGTVEGIVSSKKKINENIYFGFADINDSINEATSRGVRGIPMSFLIDKNNMLGTYTGAVPESKYIEWLNESLKKKNNS